MPKNGDAGQPGEVVREANKANATPTKADIIQAMRATDTQYKQALDKYGWANAQAKMPEAERQTYHKAVNDLRKQKSALRDALKNAKP
jgi:uncharacterized protein YdcH (DUF465 family)